jgi:hypothetical protein
LLRRLFEEDFEADGFGNIASVIVFANAFCWRAISADQKPRAGPAALLAALSHMLIQGFFIRGLLCCGAAYHMALQIAKRLRGRRP